MKMLPIIIFFLLMISIDVYAYFGLKAVLFNSHPKTYTISYIFTSLLTIFGVLLFIKAGAEGFSNNTVLTNVAFGIAFAFTIAKLFLFDCFIVEDIMRGFLWLFQSVFNFRAAELISRSYIWHLLSLSVATILFLLLNYGVLFGKYNFKVHKKVIEFENLPEEFDGFKIAQLSDMHLGTFDNKSKVKKGFDLLQAQNPDVILITGDMVNNKAIEAKKYIDLIKNLKAPFGKYTVWGNHDYGSYARWNSEEESINNLKNLEEYEKQMGLQWLNNSNIPISKNGDTIYIAGIENWGLPPFPQNGNLDKAIENLSSEDFTVLLSHDPTHWREKVLKNEKNVELTFSGHTHGMQFGIEIGDFRWSPVKYKYKDWADLFEENGKYMYVNRGFGCIAFPGRVGIWPEITIVELRKK